MANPDHVSLLYEGREKWNAWRRTRSGAEPDLSGADLVERSFRGYDFRRAKLRRADLSGADLSAFRLGSLESQIRATLGRGRPDEEAPTDLRNVDLSHSGLAGTNLDRADLRNADLSFANLDEAQLTRADIRGACLFRTNAEKLSLGDADLRGADLREARLIDADLNSAKAQRADLSGAQLIGGVLSMAKLNHATLVGTYLVGADMIGANLTEVDLTSAILVRVRLNHAILRNAKIYGVAAWDLDTSDCKQSGLRFTLPSHPEVTVDNIEMAQYLALFLDTNKVGDALKTTKSKVVLLLGRFTDERKRILDSLREELRRFDLLPVIFDFRPMKGISMLETVGLLARMSRFVVADLTDAKLVMNELLDIIPANPSLPIRPVMMADQLEPPMLSDLRKDHRDTYLRVIRYDDLEHLLSKLRSIVKSLEKRAIDLRKRDDRFLPVS